MPRVSTYLNFDGDTEEAFAFYREVFGTEYLSPITRMGDLPMPDGAPGTAPGERDKVMNVALPILAGHVLMGTDLLESMGHRLRVGNNVTINLELEDREETERLFARLSEGGSEAAPLQDMPWGASWGTCLDRFNVRWMFNCTDGTS
jgi:PhnB protein